MRREGTIVYFTKEEYQQAYLDAFSRQKAGAVTEAAGVALGSLSAFEIELLGTMGETAAAFYYQVEADMSVRGKRRSDEADITVDGRTANVKGTHIKREHKPHLLVRDYDQGQDFYVCVSVDFTARSVDMLGYASRRKLLTYPAKPFKHPKLICRAVPYKELKPCVPRVPEEPEIVFDEADLTLIDELTDGVT